MVLGVYLNALCKAPDIKLASRAGTDELEENTLIWISKRDKGLVKKFEGLSSPAGQRPVAHHRRIRG